MPARETQKDKSKRQREQSRREIRQIEKQMEKGTATDAYLEKLAKYGAMRDAENAFRDDKHGRMRSK